jgi:hypothetical protein
VVNNPLIANDDTPVAVTTGDTTSNILANDTLDGVLNPTIGTNRTSNLNRSDGSSRIDVNANGTITVNANTPSGTYTVVCNHRSRGNTSTTWGIVIRLA